MDELIDTSKIIETVARIICEENYKISDCLFLDRLNESAREIEIKRHVDEWYVEKIRIATRIVEELAKF
jgi:hypothetical protein